MSRVHYWELKNYNSGRLVGKWFDLDSCQSHEEHLDEIADWLESLGEDENGYKYEEYILASAEDVPDLYVGEYSIDSEFFMFQNAIENSHLDAEVFEAGLEIGIDLDDIEDSYVGYFESDGDFGYDYMESTGEVPDWAKSYFDYDKFGRDLAMDYSECGGHYFHN